MLNILSMGACASCSSLFSLSSLVSGIGIGFMELGAGLPLLVFFLLGLE